MLGVPCLAESVIPTPLTSMKITSLYSRDFFREKARSIGSPPSKMLRRMVRRTSTRPVRFLMLRLRESRRLIFAEQAQRNLVEGGGQLYGLARRPGRGPGRIQRALNLKRC